LTVTAWPPGDRAVVVAVQPPLVLAADGAGVPSPVLDLLAGTGGLR
jgi:hypothetical protein